MAVYKKAAVLGEQVETKPNVYISKKSKNNMAMDMLHYKATFEIARDEDGFLCAADMEQGIFTDGKDEEELMRNINDAVECHFNVPHSQVSINVQRLPN
jgi:predicted RNase H-like HicB family nuclease